MTSGVRVASTQPAIPVPAGKRVPRSVSSPSPTTASKTSSSVSASSRRIDDALAPKIERATSTIAREQSAERLLGADDAGGNRRAQVRLVGHVPPPTLFAVR